MKNEIKNNKGVTLLILTITITVLLIITGITITNSKGQLAIKNVNNLYSDLESISTKVSDYYLKMIVCLYLKILIWIVVMH